MRLFAAASIADPACAALVRVLATLRVTRWPVRWVRDDGLHLTLKYFGEVPPARLSVIEQMLHTAVAGAPALAAEVTTLGTFPPRGPARVLWAGVEAPPALELLQDRIERGAGSIGFPVEGRLFRPHVTLGRVREGERLTRSQIDRLGLEFEPTPFVIDQVVLYESVLGVGGARYSPRLSLALGA